MATYGSKNGRSLRRDPDMCGLNEVRMGGLVRTYGESIKEWPGKGTTVQYSSLGIHRGYGSYPRVMCWGHGLGL